MRCETMEYNIDRKITVYDIGIIKILSELAEALGIGMTWANWITDWGKSIETFALKGVINDGSKFESLKKMMEYSEFVRVATYQSAKNLLYIGADPSDPTNLAKYAVRAGETRIGMSGDDGLECKITKANFKHTGNLNFIDYTFDIIVGVDFELT